MVAIQGVVRATFLRQQNFVGFRAQLDPFGNLFGSVSPGVLRQGDRTGVDDLNNLLLADVVDCEQPFDRLCVEV